jgi:hypothetical protein
MAWSRRDAVLFVMLRVVIEPPQTKFPEARAIDGSAEMHALRRLPDLDAINLSIEDAEHDVGSQAVDAQRIEGDGRSTVFPGAHLEPLPAFHRRRAKKETGEWPVGAPPGWLFHGDV